MRFSRLVLALTALAASSVTLGCSSSDSKGNSTTGGGTDSFVGTWQYTSGTSTADCQGTTQTSTLTGNITLSKGSTSDLILADSDCAVKLDVSGTTANAQPGQTCTQTTTDGTGVLSLSSYVFTSSDGRTGHESASGSLTISSGGLSITCTFSSTGDLQKL